VGQHKEPQPPMRRPDFLRAKESARNAVTHRFQFVSDFMEAESKMCIDVLTEAPLGLHFPHDARDVRPEMARVFRPELLAGATERLARVAATEDIHETAPQLAIKRGNIRPNRSCVEGAVRKTRSQDLRNSSFPFHVTDGSSAWESQSQAKVDSAVTGA
jgi:hypothetical protein